MPTLKYKDPVTGEYKSDIHVVGAVSSVNGKTGVVELTNSDITDAITDVQVNGASVVTDGVANIGKASASALGVVKIGTNLGIDLASDGSVRVNRAVNSNIDDRNRQINQTLYPPIVPNNLDYAVKAAMTDGKGAAWTPAEQAAAQQRLGINKGWALKATITDGSETPIDLTGCTELVIVTSVTATGTCNLKFGDYYLVNGIGYNGSRNTYSRFIDGVVGIECVTSRQTNSFSVALEGSCNGNTYVNGLKISDIASLRVAGTASLINVNVYAR